MADLSTLVFLNPPRDYDNGIGRVKVVYGAFPSAVDNASITFHGPIEFAVPEKYINRNWSSPKPVYDEQKDELVWYTTCSEWNERHPNEGQKELRGDTSVLRIGKYFTLQGADRPTWPEDLDRGKAINAVITSVVTEAETGKIALGNLPEYQDYNNRYEIAITQNRESPQRPGETKWFSTRLAAPFEGNDRQYNTRNSVLFNTQHPSNKTVYNLSVPRSLDKCLFLDTISSSIFAELYKDKSLLWRRCKIKIDYDPSKGETLCPLLTHDQANTKFMLWIFQLDGNWIKLEYIKLRKEGSVAGYGDEVPSIKSYQLQLSTGDCKDLCVFSFGDKILLTWIRDDRAEGRIGTQAADGNIQLPLTEWKEVKITFDNSEGRTSNCGVLVRNDFVD